MTVELNRTFSEVPEAQTVTKSLLNYDSDRDVIQFYWKDLEALRHFVVIGEAGVGKSTEFKKQCEKLNLQKKFAFYIPIAELNSEKWDELLTNQDEFRRWKESSNFARFFLDSMDEARLGAASVQKILRNFKRKIGKNLLRAGVCISCRTTDWRPDDINLFEELDITFTEDIKLFHLNTLNTLQVERLIEHLHPEIAKEICSLIKTTNLHPTLTRPLDVIRIAEHFKRYARFGTASELLEEDIRSKILEWDFDRKDFLKNSKLIEAVEQLAAASVFSRYQPITLELTDSTTINAFSLLNDFSRDETKSLLSRPLFHLEGKRYVRFYHRSILEFLAAKWLKRQLNNGLSLREVFRAFFCRVETVKGSWITAIPYLRSTLAWLCHWDDLFLQFTIVHAPEALLFYGDNTELLIESRFGIVKSLMKNWEYFNYPHAFNGSVFDSFKNPEISKLLIELIVTEKICDDRMELLVQLLDDNFSVVRTILWQFYFDNRIPVEFRRHFINIKSIPNPTSDAKNPPSSDEMMDFSSANEISKNTFLDCLTKFIENRDFKAIGNIFAQQSMLNREGFCISQASRAMETEMTDENLDAFFQHCLEWSKNWEPLPVILKSDMIEDVGKLIAGAIGLRKRPDRLTQTNSILTYSLYFNFFQDDLKNILKDRKDILRGQLFKIVKIDFDLQNLEESRFAKLSNIVVIKPLLSEVIYECLTELPEPKLPGLHLLMCQFLAENSADHDSLLKLAQKKLSVLSKPEYFVEWFRMWVKLDTIAATSFLVEFSKKNDLTFGIPAVYSENQLKKYGKSLPLNNRNLLHALSRNLENFKSLEDRRILAELAESLSDPVSKRYAEKMFIEHGLALANAQTGLMPSTELSKLSTNAQNSAVGLFRLCTNLLDNLKLLVEYGEFSPRELFSESTSEFQYQKYLAAYLDLLSSGRYSVIRENEVDRKKKTDIRLYSNSQYVTLELKCAHKWSYDDLMKCLEDQLIERYLHTENSKYGIFTLLNKGRKYWTIESGETVAFKELVKQIEFKALELATRRKVFLKVLGIDFSENVQHFDLTEELF